MQTKHYSGDRIAGVKNPKQTDYSEFEDHKDPRIRLVNQYVVQRGSQDLERQLCWGLPGGAPCMRAAIKGRRLCWHCERGIE